MAPERQILNWYEKFATQLHDFKILRKDLLSDIEREQQESSEYFKVETYQKFLAYTNVQSRATYFNSRILPLWNCVMSSC